MPLLPQGPSMPDGDRGLGTICHTTPSQSQASFHGRQSTPLTRSSHCSLHQQGGIFRSVLMSAGLYDLRPTNKVLTPSQL